MMHRFYFFFFILIFIFSTGKAQRFEGGISTGLIASQVDGDRLRGYHKAGFDIGAFVRYKLYSNLDIQGDVRLAQKGSFYGGNPEKGDYSYYKLRLNYAEVPVSVRAMIKEKIWFELGLVPAYLVKAQEDRDGYGLTDPPKAFHKFELAGLAGIYYEVSKRLEACVRFSYSATKIRDHVAGQTWWFDRGQYNNLFSFVVNYKIGKVRKWQ